MGIWQEVHNLQGTIIKTLDRNNPFEVSYVGNDSVVVTPLVSGKARPISRDTIQSAYNELVLRGSLSRVEIQKKYSRFNPAYVAAILSKCQGVSFRIRPIVLHYKED